MKWCRFEPHKRDGFRYIKNFEKIYITQIMYNSPYFGADWFKFTSTSGNALGNEGAATLGTRQLLKGGQKRVKMSSSKSPIWYYYDSIIEKLSKVTHPLRGGGRGASDWLWKCRCWLVSCKRSNWLKKLTVTPLSASHCLVATLLRTNARLRSIRLTRVPFFMVSNFFLHLRCHEFGRNLSFLMYLLIFYLCADRISSFFLFNLKEFVLTKFKERFFDVDSHLLRFVFMLKNWWGFNNSIFMKFLNDACFELYSHTVACVVFSPPESH